MTSKKQNIAEYILSLWQIEDFLRAFPEKAEESSRLKEISQMMHNEGVTDTGHIQIAEVALGEAEELHQTLFATDAQYRAAAYQIIPQLAILKSKSANPAQTDIRMMFVFLYNFMLLRLQKKQISAETLALQQQVSRLLARLSAAYAQ